MGLEIFGRFWYRPSVVDDDTPIADNGRNFDQRLQCPPDREILIGRMSKQIVDDVAEQLKNEQMGGELADGQVWGETPTEQALDWIERFIWGKK